MNPLNITEEQMEYLTTCMLEGAETMPMGGFDDELSYASVLFFVKSCICYLKQRAEEEKDRETHMHLTLAPELTMFVFTLELGIGWERNRAREEELNRMIDLED